ncbi:hypothetical protein T01_2301 [Trichinella spiralis]|uniref:Uncharacterized protein n=1 Tax=Trichinella spiralis TaxID=6334 RepID=A0A0V0YZG6_TRISP|nr:hypothetical protein T01_2301 [Trichinella spiralis]
MSTFITELQCSRSCGVSSGDAGRDYLFSGGVSDKKLGNH